MHTSPLRCCTLEAALKTCLAILLLTVMLLLLAISVLLVKLMGVLIWGLEASTVRCGALTMAIIGLLVHADVKRVGDRPRRYKLYNEI